jgi:dATP/dGTP diphosphohydrolase
MSDNIKNEWFVVNTPMTGIAPEYAEIPKKGYVVKDSGARQQFETGAKRDTQTDKPRYDLISPFALKRVADLYAKGAIKYDEHNWTKGMPFSRFFASLMRHAMQFAQGDKTEDHLAAVIFNALSIIHFQEVGRTELDDMFDWTKKNSNE